MTFKKMEEKLLYSTIENVILDILNKRIQFDLLIIENDICEKHILVFEDCSSFLWSEKMKDGREEFDIKECDYYELTSMVIQDIKLYSNDSWLSNYQLDYNIVLEIWESTLVIKSNKIFLDGNSVII